MRQITLRPVTETEIQTQDMQVTGEFWTVCEVIRKIYKIASEIENKEIMREARIAHTMTKRMNRKLREYKSDYDYGWWEKK